MTPYIQGTLTQPIGIDSAPFCATFQSAAYIGFAYLDLTFGFTYKENSGLFGVVGDGAYIENIGLNLNSYTNDFYEGNFGALCGKVVACAAGPGCRAACVAAECPRRSNAGQSKPVYAVGMGGGRRRSIDSQVL